MLILYQIGVTIPISACVGGNADVAELLLRCGAEIDARDRDGKTALMIAVINGQQKLVELLLEKRADLNVKNEVGSNKSGLGNIN